MPMNPLFLARLVANDQSVTRMEQEPGSGITLDEIKELVEAAKNNTYLKTLILVDQNVDDDMVVALSTLKNIEVLTLASNKITDRGAKVLSEMPKLQQLSLAGNDVTNEGAKDLAKSNIVYLNLFGNELTNDVKSIFLSNKTLTYLGLSHNHIDDSILIEIQQHIENNKKIAVQNSQAIQPTSPAGKSAPVFFPPKEKVRNGDEEHKEITPPKSPVMGSNKDQ